MRRTKEQAAATRTQLLVAAEALFLDKGFDKVSLDEIATAAGTSRGALHWHFCNKQGLLGALRDAVDTPFVDLADGLADCKRCDPLVVLADTICSIFSDLHNDERRRGLVRVMLHLKIASYAETRDVRPSGEAYGAITRILSQANKVHRLAEPWTPKTAASVLTAVITGLVEEWALETTDLELVPYGQELVRSVISSFCPLDRANNAATV